MMGSMFYYLILVPVLVLAITCHECAHAAVARWCGDPTAQERGRLTLNPLAHLDPMGTILILLVGFGWGKPVPVNPLRLRHPRADALVSAAGPLTNLLLAFLASRGFLALQRAGTTATWAQIAALLALATVQLNLALCFFNLIPLFPLDGSHVLEHLLPRGVAPQMAALNHRYGSLILLAVVVVARLTPLDPLGSLLNPPIRFFRTLWLGA